MSVTILPREHNFQQRRTRPTYLFPAARSSHPPPHTDLQPVDHAFVRKKLKYELGDTIIFWVELIFPLGGIKGTFWLCRKLVIDS